MFSVDPVVKRYVNNDNYWKKKDNMRLILIYSSIFQVPYEF